MRRQNHACDQCRRSKRGCDLRKVDNGGKEIFLQMIIIFASLTNSISVRGSITASQPCSYCRRTNKTCTIIWAKSQQKGRGSTKDMWRSHTSRDSLMEHGLPINWQESENGQLQGVDNFLQILDYATDQATQNVKSQEINDSMPEDILDASSELYGSWNQFCSDDSPVWDISTCQNNVFASEDIFPADSSVNWLDSITYNECFPVIHAGQESSCSPFSANQMISTGFNNQLISSNLVQLYHDVLEHNLSCWLVETTCPYLLYEAPKADSSSHMEPINPLSTDNRIYRRTVELDKGASAARIISLNQSEDRAASQALRFAILAFSAQWAQGSHRAQEKFFPSFETSSQSQSKDKAFDDILQRQLWEKARTSLDKVADLESYRVAYAEVIFALTQRSWVDDIQAANTYEDLIRKPVCSTLNDIIAQDGPPIYMERAARKIHILKCRIDLAVAGQRKTAFPKPDIASILELNSQHHGTLGLLHWLVVMFDTISSSMHERPLVISDEDIQFCPSDQPNDLTQTQNHQIGQNTLGIQRFIRDNLRSPNYLPRWPCSYAEASNAVAQAAQVKVLLFRQLSCLQRYIRQEKRKSDIESLIQTAINIHSFWKSTYGRFFLQLSESIDTVPQRIQNWFICIGAHWNLAVLMLADLIEETSSQELGLELEVPSSLRELSSQLRKTGTGELAYLADVATPSQSGPTDTKPQLSDFHHAVDSSRILAEPWTMMLIKAFTKAAINILDDLEDSNQEVAQNQKKLQACTKVLWYLGKKSSMARKIADVLLCFTNTNIREPEQEATAWSEIWPESILSMCQPMDVF